MIYGTSYSDPHGLAYPFTQGIKNVATPAGYVQEPDVVDVPFMCGIDQAGNGYIFYNNRYFYTLDDLKSAFNDGFGFFGDNPNVQQAIYSAAGEFQPGPPFTRYGVSTILDVIGNLKANGVYFTAYQPPPVPQAPVAPTPSQPHAPPPGYSPLPPSWPNTIYWPAYPSLPSFDSDGYAIFDGIPLYWGLYPNQPGAPAGITMSLDPGKVNNGNYSYKTTDLGVLVVRGGLRVEAHQIDFYDALTGTPSGTFYYNSVPATGALYRTLAPPAGYSVMPGNWAPISNAWPIFGTNPVFNANGTTSFDFAKGFYTLTSAPGLNGVGLDPTKLAVGLYAYKYDDLGAITGDNGRKYELYLLHIFDLSNASDAGSFYVTTEGGGGGIDIGDALTLAGRIITGISTLGTSEAIRAVAKAAGVPDSTLNLATDAFAAAAILVASAGTAYVLSAPAAAAATAFPVAFDAASSTALISSTTAEVAAMSAAGSTLLPASLSLIAPISEIGLTAVVGGATAAGAAVPIASGAAAAPVAPTVQSAIVSGATKAVEGAVVSTATTALGTEIKKLTGQLPKVQGGYQPGGTAVIVAPATTETPAAPSVSSTTLKILAAGAAALLFLKK